MREVIENRCQARYRMSGVPYVFSGNYEWHGIFVITINGKKYQAGGTLTYKPGKLFEADVILGEHILFEFSNEQIYTVYCFLIDKETRDLFRCTLLNCLIYTTKTVFNATGQTVTSLKLIPRFALFSYSFYNSEIDIIESLSVEYNTWPEFNYPQGFKSFKLFQLTQWDIDLRDDFSLSSHETIQINPLSAKHFKAEEVFIGTDVDLQKINDTLRRGMSISGVCCEIIKSLSLMLEVVKYE